MKRGASGPRLYLGAVGSRLVVVECRHEGLAVDGVAQDLLLDLLLVREAGVVVEGVVGCRGALRQERGKMLP